MLVKCKFVKVGIVTDSSSAPKVPSTAKLHELESQAKAAFLKLVWLTPDLLKEAFTVFEERLIPMMVPPVVQ